MTTSIDPPKVLGLLDTLARETEWHGVEPNLLPPVFGGTNADQTLGDLFTVVRDLPRTYSEQLVVVTDAVMQAVVDVLRADAALPDDVVVGALAQPSTGPV